ncbi:MAG: 50S ribosomal protein L4 [Candidatus Berkelbacteria bacterium]|nr:50S ribosomal protein L4 [Candidatus Berkelbacteria bacterium]
MKIQVLNQNGEKVRDHEVSETFLQKISDSTIALYINYLQNSLRDPIANTKDRSDVSGTGKKPYKQKGTGRSRQGSNRSPLHVGGGVTFGPSNERNYHTRINKKTKRNAILGILGRLLTEEKFILIDNLEMAEPKTKKAVEILSKVGAEGKISFVYKDENEFTLKSFRNIAGILTMLPEKLNMVHLMSSAKIVTTPESLDAIEAIYSK